MREPGSANRWWTWSPGGWPAPSKAVRAKETLIAGHQWPGISPSSWAGRCGAQEKCPLSASRKTLKVLMTNRKPSGTTGRITQRLDLCLMATCLDEKGLRWVWNSVHQRGKRRGPGYRCGPLVVAAHFWTFTADIGHESCRCLIHRHELLNKDVWKPQALGCHAELPDVPICLWAPPSGYIVQGHI